MTPPTSHAGDFPTTAIPFSSGLALDLLTAIARIEQIGREGPDTCGGLILDRLVTCDAPRLRRHLPDDVLRWAAGILDVDGVDGGDTA